jgi:DNA-binding MarR family transcriptional regulator
MASRGSAQAETTPRRPVHAIITRVGLAAGRAPWNTRTGGRRVPWAELDQRAQERRHAQALRAFKVGIGGRYPGTLEQYAAAQLELDRATVHDRPPSTPPRRGTMPPLFGSTARTEILALLGINGPLTVREIARLRESDSSATFRSVAALMECGLVVKRQRAGGRKYVSLNRAHHCASELRALLAALDREHQVARITQARARWGLPDERDPLPPIVENNMFGSTMRSQILILLAIAGEADEQQIARALAVRHNSVWSALLPLTKYKLVIERRIGARRVLSLAANFKGASEFRRFLERLGVGMPIYHSKANMIAGLTRRWK